MFKKLIFIAICFALLFSCVNPAFAEDLDEDEIGEDEEVSELAGDSVVVPYDISTDLDYGWTIWDTGGSGSWFKVVLYHLYNLARPCSEAGSPLYRMFDRVGSIVSNTQSSSIYLDGIFSRLGYIRTDIQSIISLLANSSEVWLKEGWSLEGSSVVSALADTATSFHAVFGSGVLARQDLTNDNLSTFLSLLGEYPTSSLPNNPKTLFGVLTGYLSTSSPSSIANNFLRYDGNIVNAGDSYSSPISLGVLTQFGFAGLAKLIGRGDAGSPNSILGSLTLPSSTSYLGADGVIAQTPSSGFLSFVGVVGRAFRGLGTQLANNNPSWNLGSVSGTGILSALVQEGVNDSEFYSTFLSLLGTYPTTSSIASPKTLFGTLVGYNLSAGGYRTNFLDGNGKFADSSELSGPVGVGNLVQLGFAGLGKGLFNGSPAWSSVIYNNDNTTSTASGTGILSALTTLISDTNSMLAPLSYVLASPEDVQLKADQESVTSKAGDLFLDGNSDTSVSLGDLSDASSAVSSITGLFSSSASASDVGAALDNALDSGLGFFSQEVADNMRSLPKARTYGIDGGEVYVTPDYYSEGLSDVFSWFGGDR